MVAEKEHQGSRYGWRIVGERIQKERKKEGNYARRDRQLPRNLTDRLTDSRNTRPTRDVCAYSRSHVTSASY